MKGFLPIVNINKFLSNFFKSQLAKERTFLIVLVTVLTSIWFRRGLILGSGESGLPFYNTLRLLQELKSSWSDVPLGAAGSISFPSYPLYATIAFLQQLNVPIFILQAGFYWLIFIIGVLSVHKIASLIEENSSLSRISSALFYIFNPIVHISVLHRFQYPLIFFYAFMPLAFLIYLKGLKTKNFIYLIILSLVSLIFSFSFVGPAFIQLFFGILALFSIFIFLSTLRDKRDFFPLIYFLVFIVIFALVNIWWIAPLFASVFVDLGSRGSVKYFNSADNVSTFNGISEQIGSVLSVFRLFKLADIPKDDSSWGWIYSTAPFIFLSFFSAIAFILGLFKREKGLIYKFLILVSLINMFWMKGSLAPFGGVTLYLFKSFTFLQTFRNPFEKIGLLLPFVMAIPVGFGVVLIINFLSGKLKLSKYVVAILILAITFPIYMFPTITGLVFTGGPPPSNNMDIGQYVKVPPYYKDAREWLDQRTDIFRVLVLPLEGEGMTYNWEYGYSGTELSNNLFNRSMISFNTSQGGLPEMIASIKDTLLNYPDKLWILAELLNVKYIMVRDDIDYIARSTENPATVLSSIRDSLSQHFSEVSHFDKLRFFELKKEEFKPKVFASTKPVNLFDPLGKSLNLMPFANPQSNEIFILPEKSLQENPYFELADKTIINGIKIENINIDLNNPIENLPYVSVFRDTPFYALIRLKEELENQLQTAVSQLAFRVNLLGKRLAEINYSPQNEVAIKEYSQGINSLANELLSSKSVERLIIESLINQRIALEGIKKKSGNTHSIDQIVSDLDNLFINVGAKSIYPTNKDLIYRINVPKDFQYEILIPKQNWSSYFEYTGILDFDLDGKSFKLDILQQKYDKDELLLGTFNLSKGIHEVSIKQPNAKNLIAEKLPDELELSSKDRQPQTKVIPITELDTRYTYGISFEYQEEKGSVPVISLHSDIDFIDKNGERIPRLGIALTRDNYDFGWKKYHAIFTPPPASSKYYISIKIIPFGNCKAVVERPYRRYCEDSSFNQRYLQDSSTKIRNIKVERQFLNPVIIRGKGMAPNNNVAPKIVFEQISSARYKIKVSDALNPFFLVLSTTFDPRWSASFMTDTRNDMSPEKNHFVANGYANGWYIDKTGNYEMFLEYTPEKILIIGQKLALVFIIITGLILVGYFTRKQINLKNRSRV